MGRWVWPIPSILNAWHVSPSRFVLASEDYDMAGGFWTAGQPNITMLGWIGIPGNSHYGGLNMGFLDGHVELLTPGNNAQGNPDFGIAPTYALSIGPAGYFYDDNQFTYLREGLTTWPPNPDPLAQ